MTTRILLWQDYAEQPSITHPEFSPHWIVSLDTDTTTETLHSLPATCSKVARRLAEREAAQRGLPLETVDRFGVRSPVTANPPPREAERKRDDDAHVVDEDCGRTCLREGVETASP